MAGRESGSARPGLRERKKARTRATIRSVAFRLFREQGYAETTIEQIADEAEVSPSTFFRYFPTKEALVLADDLDPPMIAAFERQPADVTVFDALRNAFGQVYGNLSPEDIEFERERQRLAFSVPDLKRAAMQQMLDSIDLAAALVAHHTGRAEDDFEVRALAGAIIGAIIGAAVTNPGNLELAMRAMGYVEDGLPLGHASVATADGG
ncbi:MAG TPA: TetR family transcriptional regulator [Aldersonia sp.]